MKKRSLVIALLFLTAFSLNGKVLIFQNGLYDYTGCQDSWASKKQVYFAGAEKLIENYWTTPEKASDDTVLIQKFEFSHT